MMDFTLDLICGYPPPLKISRRQEAPVSDEMPLEIIDVEAIEAAIEETDIFMDTIIELSLE